MRHAARPVMYDNNLERARARVHSVYNFYNAGYDCGAVY